jgi:hypothetical protein
MLAGLPLVVRTIASAEGPAVTFSRVGDAS